MPPNSRRGPAYEFYRAIQRALVDQEMSQSELVEASGVPATTIALLRTSPPRDLRTRSRTVLKLARALGIDDAEALRLAGLTEPESTSLDEAVATLWRNDQLTQAQKETLEQMMRMFAQLNEQVGPAEDEDRPFNTA